MEKASETNIENNESSKLEWGPQFGRVGWVELIGLIGKMNNSLKEGEKQWRLPTEDELKIMYKTQEVLFGHSYWFSPTVRPFNEEDKPYRIDMLNGIISENPTSDDDWVHTVRLVR